MKKIMKIIGIVILCIIGLIALILIIGLVKNQIDQRRPWLKDDYYTEFKSDSPLEMKYAGFGSYEVSNEVIKVEDKTIRNYRIWYPTELKDNNHEYPLIVVTNASNTAALNYEPYFERLASWGFVVIGNDDRQTGTGVSTSQTLDYILELNNDSNSVFNNKISTENIGIVGYSQGGAGALRAVTEFDNSDKYKTIFTGSAAYAHLSKMWGGYDPEKVSIPWFMTAGTGSSDDAGVEDIVNEFGGVSPLASQIENYNKMSSDVFKVRARVSGAEHEEMMSETDGYMTAWMLYHLQNDEEAGKVFLGDDAELLSNSNWQDIEKNN